MSEMLGFMDKFVLSHINFDTLGILFCLMAVTEGFRRMGYLDRAANRITSLAGNVRSLMLLFTMACFFVSMAVTNDVALIIFVPFTIQVLSKVGRTDKLIKSVVLETIAANLGSMMTPFGNPQNVYLYRYYHMNPGEFFAALLPYGIVAAGLLTMIIFLDKSGKEPVVLQKIKQQKQKQQKQKQTGKTICYLCLFCVSILAVTGVTAWQTAVVLVMVSILLMGSIGVLCRGRENQWKWQGTELAVFHGINYGLLIKFILLFLIVGNVAALPGICRILGKIVTGNEVASGIFLSQVISNVPAAVMLSGFTDNGTGLLLGTNIGGLGTLIASMASMISLECYGYAEEADKKKYIRCFTGYNLIFLAAMAAVYFLNECCISG